MKENKSKILGTLLFVLLILSLTYLIFFTGRSTDKRVISTIEISGNKLLSVSDYLLYTKMNDKSAYKDLTLPVIKDRLEKHPYVMRADLEFVGVDRVKVILTEKNFKAVMLKGSVPYLVSEEFEVVSLAANTRYVDFTVISNPFNSEKIKSNKVFRTSDLVDAFKIMDSSEMLKGNLSEKLAEINLRNGGDILLTVSGLNIPVIFGRKDEARKVVYLEKVLDRINKGNIIADGGEFIDLRFKNDIYIGGFITTGFTE